MHVFELDWIVCSKIENYSEINIVNIMGPRGVAIVDDQSMACDPLL